MAPLRQERDGSRMGDTVVTTGPSRLGDAVVTTGLRGTMGSGLGDPVGTEAGRDERRWSWGWGDAVTEGWGH